jgi:PAS domain S-box-containing protein
VNRVSNAIAWQRTTTRILWTMLLYVLLGAAWGLLFEYLLARSVQDPVLAARLRFAAYLLLVLASAGLLLVLMRGIAREKDESQRMLSTLLSNLPGMAYRCLNTPDWPMQFVSEGSLELTGYPPSELVNGPMANFQQLIHPDDRQAVWTQVQAAVAQKAPFQLTYRLVTVTGQEKWIWEQGRGVYGPDGGLLALEGFMTEVTDRVLAQQRSDRQIQERTDELSTLLEVSRHVAGTLELEPLLRQILKQLQTVVAYDSAAVLRTSSDDQITIQAYRGPLSRAEASLLRFPAESAHLRRVIVTQEPLIIPDVRDDTPVASEYRATMGDLEPIRCWMGVPLVIRGQSVGLLSLAHRDANHYSTDHERLVRAFAVDAGLAIENAELYEESLRRAAEIESLQRITTALLEKLKLHEVLDIVYLEACQLTGATGCALFFWDGGPYLDVAQSGGALELDAAQVPLDKSLAGRAVLGGRPVVVSNPRELTGVMGLPAGVETVLAIPLRVQGSTMGALDVANKPGGFTSDDVRILSLFADAAALAIENARLNEQVAQLAVIEERQRLARELHDSVTQALYSVSLYAEATRMALSSGRTEVALKNVSELHATAREAMLDMRMLIFELRPPVLAQEGLAAALQARLTAVEARAGLHTELKVEGEKRLSLPVDTELFWVAVEALNNVVKHASARHLAVRLAYDDNSILLEICDDGVGFDPAVARQEGGMGLQGIEERVLRMRGQWEIRSAPGAGTTLRVTAAL